MDDMTVSSDDDRSEGARLQETDRGRKRELILSEAINQFNEYGYFDTRLEDVASRLGTAKTSISYHFKSKEALLLEAYQGTCDFAEAEIKLAAAAPTGLARVQAWVRAYAQAQAAGIIGVRVPLAVIHDPAALNAVDEQEISRQLKAHAAALRQFIADGIKDGSISAVSVDAATFFFLSLQQWTRRWLQNVTPASMDEAIDALLDLISYGIAADRNRKLPCATPRQSVDAEDFLFDREARNRMKLEAFLRTGARHLNRSGYRNLSLNDIAAELGVTRGSFYYHIDGKEALLKNCVDRSLDLIEETYSQYRTDERDGLSRLHLVLTSLFQGHAADVDPLIRLSLYASLPAPERRIALARLKKVTANFAELIAIGMSDGSVRPFDVEAVEQLVCGAVFGATRQRWAVFGLAAEEGRGAAPTLTAATYFQPLMSGIAARKR